MSQRRPSFFEDRKKRGSAIMSDPEVSDEEPFMPIMRIRRRQICGNSYNPEEDLQADIRKIPKSEKTRNKLKGAISDHFLFRELEPEQISTLVDAMTEWEVEAGQLLIKLGDDTNGFYVIDSGEFEVSTDGCSWERISEGNLGVLSLIHSQPSEVTVRSVTSGRVFLLDRNHYRKIVTKTNYEIRKALEELINQVPHIRDLPELDKIKVTDVLELMNFGDGDIVVKEGEPPNGMYMVVCGAVQLPGMVVQKGGHFGELLDSKPKNCGSSSALSAVACGPTKIAFLETAVYERLMGPCKTVWKKNSGQRGENA